MSLEAAHLMTTIPTIARSTRKVRMCLCDSAQKEASRGLKREVQRRMESTTRKIKIQLCAPHQRKLDNEQHLLSARAVDSRIGAIMATTLSASLSPLRPLAAVVRRPSSLPAQSPSIARYAFFSPCQASRLLCIDVFGSHVARLSSKRMQLTVSNLSFVAVVAIAGGLPVR